MAHVWLLLGATALLLCQAFSASFEEHRLRGGRDEAQNLERRELKPETLALSREAAKKPKSTSPIDDINATAVLVVTTANDTMYSVFADMMSSFDDFSKAIGQANSTALAATVSLDVDATDSIVAFVASISSLVDKAREELTSTTVKAQTALKTEWTVFDAYVARANTTLEMATEAVKKVVEDAKGAQANEGGEQVLLQMRCCSGNGGSATSQGIWDWVKNVFGGGASLCAKAHDSISSANSTIDKLSEGLRSTNASASDGIHEWGDVVKARVELLQADVNSTGSNAPGMPSGIGPEVSEALEAVPAGLKKALKGLSSVDLKAAKVLKNSKSYFKAAHEFINDLDLQATAACAAKAAAKKTSGAAPCDHRC